MYKITNVIFFFCLLALVTLTVAASVSLVWCRRRRRRVRCTAGQQTSGKRSARMQLSAGRRQQKQRRDSARVAGRNRDQKEGKHNCRSFVPINLQRLTQFLTWSCSSVALHLRLLICVWALTTKSFTFLKNCSKSLSIFGRKTFVPVRKQVLSLGQPFWTLKIF